MSARSSLGYAGIAVVATLLASAPAWACGGDAACACAHAPAAAKPVTAPDDPQGKGAPDEGVSATCNCEGPSDCTCKKGQCKCKKCSKHHAGGAAKKT